MSNLKMKEQEAWVAYIDALEHLTDAAMHLRRAIHNVGQHNGRHVQVKLSKSNIIARDAYDVALANTQVKREEYETAAADKEIPLTTTKNPWRTV